MEGDICGGMGICYLYRKTSLHCAVGGIFDVWLVVVYLKYGAGRP